MAELASVKTIVHGRVTGIGFRAFVEMKAQGLGLKGYVRNVERAVEMEAEGEKDKLEQLIGFIQAGPRLARVESVDVEWSEYRGQYSDFTVRR